jgi:hypothetical protein
MGMWISTAIMKNGMVAPQKIPIGRKCWGDTCILMSIAALPTIAKIQNKQVAIDGWMEKESVWDIHTHTHEYVSTIEDWNPVICNNMDGTGGH